MCFITTHGLGHRNQINVTGKMKVGRINSDIESVLVLSFMSVCACVCVCVGGSKLDLCRTPMSAMTLFEISS